MWISGIPRISKHTCWISNISSASFFLTKKTNKKNARNKSDYLIDDGEEAKRAADVKGAHRAAYAISLISIIVIIVVTIISSKSNEEAAST